MAFIPCHFIQGAVKENAIIIFCFLNERILNSYVVKSLRFQYLHKKTVLLLEGEKQCINLLPLCSLLPEN